MIEATTEETPYVELYEPNDPQKKFHDARSTHRRRWFVAGIQGGKTEAGAFESFLFATRERPGGRGAIFGPDYPKAIEARDRFNAMRFRFDILGLHPAETGRSSAREQEQQDDHRTATATPFQCFHIPRIRQIKQNGSVIIFLSASTAKEPNMRRITLLLVALILTGPIFAAELEGVTMPDKKDVAGESLLCATEDLPQLAAVDPAEVHQNLAQATALIRIVLEPAALKQAIAGQKAEFEGDLAEELFVCRHSERLVQRGAHGQPTSSRD